MKSKTTSTKLICTECNNIQIIYRKLSNRKKFGHMKYLYCYKCKRIINHFEICEEEIQEITNSED